MSWASKGMHRLAWVGIRDGILRRFYNIIVRAHVLYEHRKGA